MLTFQWRKDDLRRRFYPSDFRGMYQRFEEVIREYVVDGSRVLDAGCGSGRIFRYDVGSTGALIVGVDITRSSAISATSTARCLAMCRFSPSADASFEVVLTSHVVEHLPRPEAAFREMVRVLRPGGRLLVLTPNRFHYVPLLAGSFPIACT